MLTINKMLVLEILDISFSQHNDLLREVGGFSPKN